MPFYGENRYGFVRDTKIAKFVPKPADDGSGEVRLVIEKQVEYSREKVTGRKIRVMFASMYVYDDRVFVHFRPNDNFFTRVHVFTLDLEPLYQIAETETCHDSMMFNGDFFVLKCNDNYYVVYETKTGDQYAVVNHSLFPERKYAGHGFVFCQNTMTFLVRLDHSYQLCSYDLITRSWLPPLNVQLVDMVQGIHNVDLRHYNICLRYYNGHVYIMYSFVRQGSNPRIDQHEFGITRIHLFDGTQTSRLIKASNEDVPVIKIETILFALVYKTSIFIHVIIEGASYAIVLKIEDLTKETGTILLTNVTYKHLVLQSPYELTQWCVWKGKVYIVTKHQVMCVDISGNETQVLEQAKTLVHYDSMYKENNDAAGVIYRKTPLPETTFAIMPAPKCTFDEAAVCFSETFKGEIDSNPYWERLIELYRNNWGYYGRMLDLLQLVPFKGLHGRVRDMIHRIKVELDGKFRLRDLDTQLYNPGLPPSNEILRAMVQHTNSPASRQDKKPRSTVPRRVVDADPPMAKIAEFLGVNNTL